MTPPKTNAPWTSFTLGNLNSDTSIGSGLWQMEHPPPQLNFSTSPFRLSLYLNTRLRWVTGFQEIVLPRGFPFLNSPKVEEPQALACFQTPHLGARSKHDRFLGWNYLFSYMTGRAHKQTWLVLLICYYFPPNFPYRSQGQSQLHCSS